MQRITHKANKINPKGDVSALCFKEPRKINMKTESWTITDSAVTCKKCLKELEETDKCR